MRNRIRLIAIILLLVAGVFSVARAQQNAPNPNMKHALRQVSTEVYFRIGAKEIDMNFEGNKIRLSLFLSELNQVLSDSNYVVSRLVIVGTSSPDGKKTINERLAGRRAQVLADYLTAHTILPKQKVEVVNDGVNWTGLRMMIESSDKLPHKDAMLRLMDIADPQLRKHKMMFYADSQPWLWMLKHFFPSLRKGAGIVSFSYELSPKVKARMEIKEHAEASAFQSAINKESEKNSVSFVQRDSTTLQMPPLTKSRSSFRPLVALKSDLLLWSGLMPGFKMGTWTPNLSAEVYFAPHWSAQVGCVYSDWDALSGGKYLYALSAADLEVRGWFGAPSAYKGFYLGTFGTFGEYDVQEEIQGNTGSFWIIGLGAGYLFPLSPQWGIEAQIRGGYRSAKNEGYEIEQGHYYISGSRTVGKFVPQVRLQVVYRFGTTGNKR